MSASPEESSAARDAGLNGRRAALGAVVAVVPRVLRYMWDVAPRQLAVQGTLIAAMAGLPAAIVWSTKVVFDAVVGAAAMPEAWPSVLAALAVLLAFWVASSACEAIARTTGVVFQETIWYAGRQRIAEKAGSLDLAFFENPRFYDQLHQADREIHRLGEFCYACMGLVQQILSMAAMSALLALLHPLAVVLLIGTALPRIVLEGSVARKRFELSGRLARDDRVLEYSKRLLVERGSAPEVRAFRLTGWIATRFEEHRKRYLAALGQLLFHLLRRDVVLSILSLAGLGAIWAYAAFQAVLARITVGDLAMVFQASQNSRDSLEALVREGGRFYENALFATRFFELIDLDPQSVDGALAPARALTRDDDRTATPDAQAHPTGSSFPRPVRQGFELRDVSFTYPDAVGQTLAKVCFAVPAGRKVAIVGENGAGKSTLVKLLVRLYDPTEGQVLLDGLDLKEYDLHDFRRHVGVVFQEFHRYEMSAADNVGLGRIEAIDDRDSIHAAARKAGAHDIVAKLPSGYDTMLGRTFDAGVDLSGGEWQHLAIARGFMSQAPILILDEPTAVADAFRERRLHEQLAGLEDRTVVFTSHRFSTVRLADSIVVIDKGQVVEMGDHEALMAAAGKYAAMFDAQAEKYRG